MAVWLQPFLTLADQSILWSLTPLGIYLLLSGLDDLFIDVVFLYMWVSATLFRRPRVVLPTEEQLAAEPEKRFAIFVPLWKEAGVIWRMLANNAAAIRYRNYDFFVGAYPNDAATLAAVSEAEKRFANVHLAVCAHPGPTSKADCLNWIFQRMLLHEEKHGVRYDVIVTHDAEDLIHPDSLRWMNWFANEYAFVQVPIVSLPTPWWKLTQGIYCDEFAEFQARDLPVRNLLGGFVPSAGVGTAYTREALEAMAESSCNRIFEPGCLTEDYENGFRLSLMGFRQIFMPIVRRGTFVATREFFPEKFRRAIRQRTRWTTGIALQGWEHHGWSGGLRQIYWLWRDRKGLIGNPLSLLTNAFCAYGIAARIWERVRPEQWLWEVLSLTLGFQTIGIIVRMACSGRLYGWRFAMLVPVRAIMANVINACATFNALKQYALARIQGKPLVWLKTDHAYPTREALMVDRRMIGEILVNSQYIEPEDLEWALATKPEGKRIGEHLVAAGRLSESDLYEALSLQQQLPLATLSPHQISRRVAHTLPARLSSKWQVLPFRIQDGEMHIAATEAPAAEMEQELRNHTSLEIRFHLITPTAYRELERVFK